jgi:hypothetical protein
MFCIHNVTNNTTEHICINVTLGARSRNHSCHGKAVSIKYSERVCSVALFIQHNAHAPYCTSIIICGPTVSTIFSHFISYTAGFSEEKKKCFDFLYEACLKHLSSEQEFSKILS